MTTICPALLAPSKRGTACLDDRKLSQKYVQERVLGEDGQPRKMKDGEDEFHMGLVLEWVFGTIVSTAEKARDSAKRYLGEFVPKC